MSNFEGDSDDQKDIEAILTITTIVGVITLPTLAREVINILREGPHPVEGWELVKELSKIVGAGLVSGTVQVIRHRLGIS